MIRKFKSIIDGNPIEVINLKVKRLFDRSFHSKNLKIPNRNLIYKTPIIINSMNRLSYLKKQISWLENCGLKNIIIIDNQSTYLPLIEFYDKINYQVIRNQRNMGYLALWYNPFFDSIRNNFYIYTDSDVVASDKCPKDFIEYFYDSLINIKSLDKIGFSLNIKNLDQDIDKKFNIIKNEKKFWCNKYANSNIFKAPIDTTFALYKPFTYGGYWLNSGRTNYPYTADHLPWLETSLDNDEIIFYESNLISKNSFYQSYRNKKY